MTKVRQDDGLDAWADTWFGDPGTWPPALTAAAVRCLAEERPVAVTWGPDFRLLYNAEYAALLGDQHPGVRGRPAWEAVPAMWPVVGPLLHRVVAAGESVAGERVPLPRDSPSGVRTHWYSWTYAPIWSDGRVDGVFALVLDETNAELAARHDEALASAGQLADADDLDTAIRELVRVLGTMPDARFAVCHRLAPDGSWTRAAQAGRELTTPTAASLLTHTESTGRWPLPPGSAPGAVRPPDGSPRGLGASWSFAVRVYDVDIALTLALSPLVGDADEHPAFVAALARRMSTETA
ncbi:PAS domain-containing protein [Jatrophihabitans sp. YIM 134969]